MTNGWSEDVVPNMVRLLPPILLDFWDCTPTSYRRDAGIPIADEGQIPYPLPCPIWQHVAAFAVVFLHQYLWQMQAQRSEGPPAPGWWPWGEASPALWCSGLSGPLPRQWHFAAMKERAWASGISRGRSLLYLPSLFLLGLYIQMGVSVHTRSLPPCLSHPQRCLQDLLNGPMDVTLWTAGCPPLRLQRVNAPNFVASINPLH